ncbi:hypothetical protein HK100_000118 [Physocladia obscura]|uniref:Alpha/beta hydrolase fold-3 domain-containing protein n=1 Tax=Physocladia obscura TaxID=109957 RepID=A0AAD5SYV0_9FUNG|nr:hypothetical protein HK100_000118 [Physocladia obscura]
MQAYTSVENLKKCLLLTMKAPIRLASGDIRTEMATLPETIDRKEIAAESRETGRSIKVHMYQKKGQSPGPKPVHLNWHGSGYVVNNLGTDSSFCSYIALSTSRIVLDCDYRKAPQHPFPAGIHDVLDMIAYVYKHPEQFDLSAVTIGGFSAGGSMALCAAAISGPEIVHGVAAIYGNPDLAGPSQDPPSSEFDGGYQISPGILKFFYDCVFVPPQSLADEHISSKYAPIDRFPKNVFLACGEADGVHANNFDFTKRLTEAGKDAVFMSIEREAHGFDKNVKNDVTRERKNRAYEVFTSGEIPRLEGDVIGLETALSLALSGARYYIPFRIWRNKIAFESWNENWQRR